MSIIALCITAGGGIIIVSLSNIQGKEKSATEHLNELGEERDTHMSVSFTTLDGLIG